MKQLIASLRRVNLLRFSLVTSISIRIALQTSTLWKQVGITKKLQAPNLLWIVILLWQSLCQANAIALGKLTNLAVSLSVRLKIKVMEWLKVKDVTKWNN